MEFSFPEKHKPLCPNEENEASSDADPRVLLWKKNLPGSASFSVLLTLLTSAPRKVMCVCLQPRPPFLPHRAAPWAPCFLTNTWSAPECSPVTLCLNDRHRSPECMRWPRGSTKRAAFPPGPLAPDTVRYCPPAMGKAGLCVYVLTSLSSTDSIKAGFTWNKLQTEIVICTEFQIF